MSELALFPKTALSQMLEMPAENSLVAVVKAVTAR